MEYEIQMIFFVLFASFAAYIFKALAGFGLSLILVPILSVLIGFREAVLIATLSDLLSSMYLMSRSFRKLKFRRISTILVGLVIGTFVGVQLFGLFSVDLLMKLFGIFLIITVVKGFLQRNNISLQKGTKLGGFITGLCGGLLGGLFNTNGPPIVLYLKKVYSDPDVIRTNLSAIFAFDAIWRTGLFVSHGAFSLPILEIFVLGAFPGILIGMFVGESLIKKVSSQHFRYLVESTLFLIGGGLLFR